MKRRRIAALALFLALLFGTMPALAAEADGWLVPKTRDYAGQFADVTGSWCEAAVKTVYEAGLMEGTGPDRFDSQGTLTCPQILVISARLHSLLNGGDGTFPTPGSGEAWYAPAAAYLDAVASSPSIQWSGIVSHSTRPCRRADFVEMLAAVLPMEALPAVNDICTLPDVALDTYTQNIFRFYNAGILSGSNEYGTFHRDEALTRGQAAAMLARVVDPGQRLHFTVRPFDLCQAVFGVEAGTVFFIIDGVEITAQLSAEPFCAALLEENPPFDVEFEICSPFIFGMTLERLAKKHGLPIPDYDVKSYSSWERAHNLLLVESILSFYAERDGEVFSPESFADDPPYKAKFLSDCNRTMHREVVIETTSAFDSLDLDAVRERLLASPYCN